MNFKILKRLFLTLFVILFLLHATFHILAYGVNLLVYKFAGLSKLSLQLGSWPISLDFLQIRQSLPRLGLFSLIFLGLELAILILIVISIRHKRKKAIANPAQLPYLKQKIAQKRSKEKTDIDILYEALQEKEKIKISTVSRAFEIERDLAIDWGKALESANLVTIGYSNIKDPELIVVNKVLASKEMNKKPEDKEDKKPEDKDKESVKKIEPVKKDDKKIKDKVDKKIPKKEKTVDKKPTKKKKKKK
tara:strand:- start:2828 stop:3571 length:744 start_codon:yes stop_codon:yes gene_type:complete